MNDRLRSALASAALTPEDLATRVQVDPKTVQKWLARGVPHPRHRWSVADLFGEHEEFLWPAGRGRHSDGDGGAEVIAAYPRRANVEAARWRVLVGQAGKQIDMLGYTLYFLPQQLPELVDQLLQKCDQGCWLRMILADPDPDPDPDCDQVRLRDEEEGEPITIVARIRTSLRAFEPLQACPNADVRFQTAPLYNSVYRFDDEMFVTPHLFATPGHAAPLFHLRRLGPNGLFSRFASHYEQLWSASRTIGQDQASEVAPAAS